MYITMSCGEGHKSHPCELGRRLETWEHKDPQGARSTARSPRIAADNSRIVFTLSAPGGQQIASVDMSGKNLKRLTQSSGTNCWPSISPDGSKIAFSSSRDGVFRIYTMNADGSDVTRLSGGVLRAMRPAWSPDGKQIAYTVDN